MLDGLDPGAHLPLVVVVGGSAVVSLTVAAWAAFRLEPRASLVALVVSILGAVGYQARFLLPAIATDPEAAAFYASLFAWSPALMASSGLHFMVLLNELRIGRTLAFCAVLYGGALVVFSGHTSGLVVTRAVSDPVFGYLLEQSGPLDPFQRAYGGLCILALVGLAARYAIHWRYHPTRSRAAVVLVGGLALPMIGAIATITRVVDLPLYNLAVPLFHASLVVAIRRHELLTFNIEEAARPTLDAAGEAIVVVEPNGEILWLNRAAAEVYGLEVGTRPFGSDIRPCLEGAAAGSPCRGVAAEVRGVACLVAMSPIPHPEQVRVAMALTDVRHLRAAERGLVEAREVAEAARAEAEAADRAKSTFLANMSHELRTPLNAIIGYGELLREDADPEQTPDLDRIIASGRYLLRLLGDVLDLSKLDAGRLEVSREIIDLRGLLGEVEDAGAVLARENGNVLAVDARPATAMGDPIRVRQIVLNLLSNAAKFTREGRVDLRCGVDGARAFVEVEDNGIGMSPEQIDRLFRRFEQVHDERHADYGGTGLGLALSRDLAEVMGGALEVESQREVGSRFRLWLPGVHGGGMVDTGPTAV